MRIATISIFMVVVLGPVLSSGADDVGSDEDGKAVLIEDIPEPQEAERNMFSRQALKEDDPNCLKRWPNAYVPYVIHSTLPHNAKEHLLKAVKLWEEVSCMKIEDITDKTDEWNQPHLVIANQGYNCESTIGRYCNQNGQTINLSPHCGSVTVIQHELAHAFGMTHQQGRPDRDQYIKVFDENVQKWNERDFQIKDSDTYGLPYDYTSLLQYSKYQGTKHVGRPTVVTLDPLKQYLLGSAKRPSHFDKNLLNLMYNCSGHCENPPICENYGYVNKHCKCECPHNTDGERCENLNGDYYPKTYDKCGDQLIETDTIIKSFNFPDVKPLHPRVINCLWHMKAPVGKRAQVTFDKFNLYYHKKCLVDRVDVMQDGFSLSERACGTQLQGKTITATDNDLVLLWIGRTPGWRTGFSATVTFIDAP